jgi:hypothetical protein
LLVFSDDDDDDDSRKIPSAMMALRSCRRFFPLLADDDGSIEKGDLLVGCG